MGFSIGMSPSASASTGQGVQPRGPALPALPPPLPSISTNTTGQLKPLNLSSMHLSPPMLNLSPNEAGRGRTRILQQVPFAMDSILGRNPVSAILEKPGMCRDEPAKP
jgi:hypothetical protein